MTRCPSIRDLTLDDALRAHLDACPACRREYEALSSLATLARSLPQGAPSSPEARVQLLARAALAPPARRPSRAWLVAGLALGAATAGGALVVGVVGVIGARLASPAWNGSVRSVGEAHFEHLGAPFDEVVRLADGTIAIAVARLAPGQRFRVLTDDGEVEVRGTEFRVTATAHHLEEVVVEHGRVEVRRAGILAATLGAGERWSAASAPAATLAPRSEARVEAPRSDGVSIPLTSPRGTATRSRRALSSSTQAAATPTAATVAAATPAAATPAELAFDEGWSALRNGEYRRAATAFERSARAGEGEPIADDAGYWCGVAWARAGDGERAATQLRRWLTDHAQSAHAGEVASILGWLRFDAGDLGEASRCFERAARDPSPAVRQSARKGLAAVAAAPGAAHTSTPTAASPVTPPRDAR